MAKGEKIEITVPVHLIGDPVGVKTGGGMLEQMIREIKVLCDPTVIPDSIDVDVSDLDVNQSVHISDLKVGNGIEIHEDADSLVATVIIVKEETEAAEESGEPVVIEKGKNEE